MTNCGIWRCLFLKQQNHPIFEKSSFRIKKKIFATYDASNHRACLKLSEVDQDVFSAIDRQAIFPVENKWGKMGWTFVDLNQVDHKVFTDALTQAYCEVAPVKLAELVRRSGLY